MVPNVIQDLIMKYNEPGVMIENKDQLYWFNGIRFEFWCVLPNSADVLYYKQKLYIYQSGKLQLFTNKAFVNIQNNKNIILKHFETTCSSLFIVHKGRIIDGKDMEFRIFDGRQWNPIFNQKIYTPHGFGMHKNTLYLFCSNISLKYDCKTKKIHHFKNACLSGKCKYVNSKFYFFNKNGICKQMFDPEDDIFYEMNLLGGT